MTPAIQAAGAGAAPAVPAASVPPFELVHLLLAAGLLAGAVLVGVVVQRILASRLHARARKTSAEWDNILIDSMRGLVVLWFLLIGLAVALKVVPLRPGVLMIAGRGVGVLGILSAVIFFTRVARRTIYVTIDRKIEVPSTIFKNFAAFLIYLLGFLFVLDYLGVSITPLLTALGVSGLAVALALQDTLSNLFAGLNILMARKIRPGDYVRLDTGEEGVVCDVSWRSTTIGAPDDNQIVVPNAKLASAIYTNTHLPEKEMGLFLPVTVAFASDLARVERVTLETASEVLAAPGLAVPGFEPAVRFNAFTELGVRFNVILRVKEYRDLYLLRHEFYKRLHTRYRDEGIRLAELPRPAALEKP